MTINMDLPSPDRVFNLPPPAPTCQICGKNLIVVGIDTENDRSSWVCATHPKKRLERDEPSLQNTSRRPAKTKQLPLKCPTCGRKMNEYGSEDNYPQAWYCLRDNVKIDSLTGTRYSGDMDRDRFIDFRATIRTERSLFLERRLHLTDDALLISKDGQLESRLPLGEISEISTEDYRTIDRSKLAGDPAKQVFAGAALFLIGGVMGPLALANAYTEQNFLHIIYGPSKSCLTIYSPHDALRSEIEGRRKAKLA